MQTNGFHREVRGMALRFRRSMKVGKGIRLNVSKRGIGMSVGKRGLRRSIHSTGRSTGTIGIPGTGLSYVDTKTSSKRRKSRNNVASGAVKQSTEENVAVVEEYNNYIDGITHLHLNVPKATDWKEIRMIQAPFQPDEIGPLESTAMAQLNQYQPNLIEKVFKPLKKRKKQQLTEEIQAAHEQDARNYQKWEYDNNLAGNVLDGTPEAYEQVIKENPEFAEARKGGMSLRVLNANTVEIEVQVLPDEVVPNKTLSLTKTGKISRRKMGKIKYYGIMKDFVSGYVMSVAKEVFASLPIEFCMIHVNEKALNTATGHRKNKVLLSVLVDRETLHHLDFDYIVPSDALENFQHNIDHLKTKGFRPVERISN